ncbi:hypothetical protein JCM11491_002340 [Sporobolomyces phaffii]
MGVRDLFPTLRKLVPDAVRPLASLSALPHAAKFAIDGHLVTTKLHFGGGAGARPVVEGWYRLLRELNLRGIGAVVVFDCDVARNRLKARERVRRHTARALSRSRGEAELVRTERLELLRDARPRREGGGEVAAGLYDEFRRDRDNPVYSKTQRLLSVEEGRVYASILPTVVAVDTDTDTDTEPDLDDHVVDLDSLVERSARLSQAHLSRSVPVPRHVFHDVKALIAAMGYPVLTPMTTNDEDEDEDPPEAESVCSLLYHRSDVTGVTHVVSEDTDVLVYSAKLLRKLSTSTSTSTTTNAEQQHEMTVTDPDDVREQLGLDRLEFTDWCLLCGTDFTDRLPLLGPSRALALVRQYGSIEAAFKDDAVRTKYFPPPPPPGVPVDEDLVDAEPERRRDTFDEYMDRVDAARKVFLELPRLIDVVRECETHNVLTARDDLDDDDDEVRAEWFDKKEERTDEVERLKRRFGIATSRGRRPGGRGRRPEDDGGVELDDEWSSEDEFLKRYKVRP